MFKVCYGNKVLTVYSVRTMPYNRDNAEFLVYNREGGYYEWIEADCTEPYAPEDGLLGTYTGTPITFPGPQVMYDASYEHNAI